MQPIKTLRAELKIEISDAKTLLAELPACVALMREVVGGGGDDGGAGVGLAASPHSPHARPRRLAVAFC